MDFELKNMDSNRDKIAIVTGANTGLGFETTLGLLEAGFAVVMACRNEKKAKSAMLQLESQVSGAVLHYIPLDLADMASIHLFANQFIHQFDRLDVLIENAGIMMPAYNKTVDGFESQLGVNFLGHFLLTKLLYPVLAKTKNSRIISLSSVAHKNARIHFSDLQSENKYSKFGAYAQSKLACFMFGYELHRRLLASNSEMKSIIAHPGGSDTELGRHLSPFWYKLFLPIILLFTHSPKQAAKPTLMAALDNGVSSGDLVGPTGFAELKGKPGVVLAKPHAYNELYAQKLWEKAEELIKMKFEI
jgi:NAD(P)-dependent dehydrogenase (short-subunit alcohol dehydrogenase family)